MSQRILISGAGIAGLGLANCLGKIAGIDVVLIDRTPEIVSRGHFMTLKGSCVDVLKAMGLDEQVRRHEWPSNEWDWVTNSGRPLRRIPKTVIGTELGGFLSVRRAHLHRVLFDALPDTIDRRFGHAINTLADDGDHVDVEFSSGMRESFDAVVGADGVHSSIRQLHFPEISTRDLGGRYIVFVVTQQHRLGACTRTIWGAGRSVSLIPLATDQLGVMIYQDDQHPPAPTTLAPIPWRSYLAGIYTDFPDQVGTAIDALQDSDDVFADRITMVPASRLVKNRVALLGDAGYCPTFFSGMGAAAALLGAWSLAGQVNAHPMPEALRRYEAIMLPIVRGYQQSAAGGTARNMPRGLKRITRDFLTRAMPRKLGSILSRRRYRTDVTLAALRA